MNGPLAAVDAQVVGELFVEAPGEVNASHHAPFAPNKHPHGVFHRDVLHPFPLNDLQLDDGSEEVAKDVHRVGAVVDEDPAAADFRVGVPAVGHVHAGGEGVFEEDEVADEPRGDNGLGLDHVGDVTEFGGHGEQSVGLLGGIKHRAGFLQSHGQRLLAEDIDAAGKEPGTKARVRARGRTEDDRVGMQLVYQVSGGSEGLALHPFGHGSGDFFADIDDADELSGVRMLKGLAPGLSDSSSTDESKSHLGDGHVYSSILGGTPTALRGRVSLRHRIAAQTSAANFSASSRRQVAMYSTWLT